jgi:hypothetical protein
MHESILNPNLKYPWQEVAFDVSIEFKRLLQRNLDRDEVLALQGSLSAVKLLNSEARLKALETGNWFQVEENLSGPNGRTKAGALNVRKAFFTNAQAISSPRRLYSPDVVHDVFPCAIELLAKDPWKTQRN